MTADVGAGELISLAAQCVTCGKEHQPREYKPGWAPTWAAPDDGHIYRPRLPGGSFGPLAHLRVIYATAREEGTR